MAICIEDINAGVDLMFNELERASRAGQTMVRSRDEIIDVLSNDLGLSFCSASFVAIKMERKYHERLQEMGYSFPFKEYSEAMG